MRSPLRTLVTTAVVVVMAAAAWMLWPKGLGGRTTYVVTHGVSMEPGFHTGDLAILHRATAYRVGDVAAYHSDTLHTVVMHRIEAVDSAGGFVFKGDNNGWLDPDHPVPSKLVGRLWVRVPAGGKYLKMAHGPWALGILGAVMIATGSSRVHRRKRRRVRRASTRQVRPAPNMSFSRGPAIGAVTVAVAATLGAGYLWSVPTSTAGSRSVTVTHNPTMTYDAAARAGATYPDGVLHTGQPVYLRLVQLIRVRVSDPLSATAPLGPVHTTAAITVTLANPAGWTSTLNAGAPTDLAGGPATVTLDLPSALRQLQAVATETGVGQPGGTVTVAIHLVSRTSTAGHPIDSTADTAYGFSLDQTELRPTAAPVPAASGTSATATGSSAPSGLVTSVKIATVTPATIGLRGHRVSVRRFRLLLTLLAAACALVAAGLLLGLRSADAAAAKTRRSFGRRVLDVTSLNPNDRIVTVASTTALVKIADRYERLVLHLSSEQGDVYAVHEDGISYRYTDAPTGNVVRHLWSAA